jgi:hypothetical protein
MVGQQPQLRALAASLRTVENDELSSQVLHVPMTNTPIPTADQ